MATGMGSVASPIMDNSLSRVSFQESSPYAVRAIAPHPISSAKVVSIGDAKLVDSVLASLLTRENGVNLLVVQRPNIKDVQADLAANSSSRRSRSSAASVSSKSR